VSSIYSRLALCADGDQTVLVGHAQRQPGEFGLLLFSRFASVDDKVPEVWAAPMQHLDVKYIKGAAFARGDTGDRYLIVVGSGLRDVRRDEVSFVIRYDVEGRCDDAQFAEGVSSWKHANTFPINRGLHALYVYPDGRLLLGGNTEWTLSSRPRFLLARLMPDGSLDHAFGDGGITITNLTAGNDICMAVTVCRDGSILAVGVSNTTGYTAAAMALYHRDGKLDESFGRAGRLVASFGDASMTKLLACMEDTDGHLVVAGYQGDSDRRRAVMVSMDRRGRLIPAFADRGVFKDLEKNAPSAVHSLLPGKGCIVAGGCARGVSVIGPMRNDGGYVGDSVTLEGDRVSDMAWGARGLVVNAESLNRSLLYRSQARDPAAASGPDMGRRRSSPPAPKRSPQPATAAPGPPNPFAGKSEAELKMIAAETHDINMDAMNFAMSLPRGHSW